MERKKTLITEYKQRKVTSGIYRVTNTKNGMYLLDNTTNLQAKKNRFAFQVSSSSCFHHKLSKDWATFGSDAFIFEVLEALEKKEEQCQDEFVDDLKILEQMWSEKLDPSKRY